MFARRNLYQGFTLLIVLVSTLTACNQPEGEQLLQARCTSCHEKSEIAAKDQPREDWSQIVSQMLVYGADLTENEQQVLVDYLVENYGP